LNDVALLPIIVAVLGSGGIIGGVVAFFKLRPENARTTVGAAEGAVIVQSGVIASLRDEITRLREERDELRELLEVIDERKTARDKDQT
jgi:cysteine synthase